jgi:demethylmenaquinone methyltransferase/2-methoxy-6-polyprenyl-1,4-benzoquinol methylase
MGFVELSHASITILTVQHAKPEDLLAEQLAYYRARAQEYDESVLQSGRFAGPGIPQADAEWQHIVAALHALARVERTLELACGTGLWTQELLGISRSILALDGAPEMLAVNRAKLNSDKVRYQQADLFNWQPVETYDLVFAAFWLSHVSPALLAGHLEQLAKTVRLGGRVFLVD